MKTMAERETALTPRDKEALDAWRALPPIYRSVIRVRAIAEVIAA